jgi:ComF family protein
MKTFKFTQKLNLLKEYLFPVDCAICGVTLLKEAEAWFGLCTSCASLLPNNAGQCCAICGRPLISEMDVCMSCRRAGETAYDGMTLLYPYIGNTQTLLKAYKFGKHRVLANFFAEKMLSSLTNLIEGRNLAHEIPLIPVPPRHGKIKAEGWDQIECLAQTLEKQKEVTVLRCLKRLSSEAQKKLGKSERMTNLQGRIRCIKKVPDEVVVFDDVFTTGSTMSICAQALKEAGAKKVHGLCLFYG